jgi:hypothetical protein
VFTKNRFPQLSPVHELGESARRRCRRRSTLWEEEEEKRWEKERLDLAQQMAPWVYFYSRPDGRGTASPERTTKPPQLR